MATKKLVFFSTNFKILSEMLSEFLMNFSPNYSQSHSLGKSFAIIYLHVFFFVEKYFFLWFNPTATTLYIYLYKRGIFHEVNRIIKRRNDSDYDFAFSTSVISLNLFELQSFRTKLRRYDERKLSTSSSLSRESFTKSFHENYDCMNVHCGRWTERGMSRNL